MQKTRDVAGYSISWQLGVEDNNCFPITTSYKFATPEQFSPSHGMLYPQTWLVSQLLLFLMQLWTTANGLNKHRKQKGGEKYQVLSLAVKRTHKDFENLRFNSLPRVNWLHWEVWKTLCLTWKEFWESLTVQASISLFLSFSSPSFSPSFSFSFHGEAWTAPYSLQTTPLPWIRSYPQHAHPSSRRKRSGALAESPVCVHTWSSLGRAAAASAPALWDRAGHPLWTWDLQLIKGGSNRDLELVSSQGPRFHAEIQEKVFQITMNPWIGVG